MGMPGRSRLRCRQVTGNVIRLGKEQEDSLWLTWSSSVKTGEDKRKQTGHFCSHSKLSHKTFLLAFEISRKLDVYTRSKDKWLERLKIVACQFRNQDLLMFSSKISSILDIPLDSENPVFSGNEIKMKSTKWFN